jgi:hypothetical protein
LDVLLEDEGNLVDALSVEGVDQGQLQHAIGQADRKALVETSGLGGHRLDDLRGEVTVPDGLHLGGQMVRDNLEDRVQIHDPEVLEDLHGRLAGAFEFRRHLFVLEVVDEAQALDERKQWIIDFLGHMSRQWIGFRL